MNTNTQSKVIWYCHPYAGAPSMGMSYRPYYFCKLFNQNGLSAHVITANFHHMLVKKFPQSEQIEQRLVEEVSYITVKTAEYKGNGWKRLLNMFTYAWRIYRNEKSIIEMTGKPDVIIVSSSHPLHYPILKRIAAKYNAKLVFEVRDIWPLSLQEILNISAWHPFIMLLSWIEKMAYKESDLVVSLLKNALVHMQKKGLKSEKFRYIPNGVLIEGNPKPAKLDKSLLEKLAILKFEGKFLLGYTGSMGPPNALSYLVEAMEILQKNKSNVHAILVGKGTQSSALKTTIQKMNLSNIEILDEIPKNQIPAFLNAMNTLYLGWNNIDLYKFGTSPNKLYDYLLSGNPIIESGGEQPSIITSHQCGIQCEAANPLKIAESIELMANKSQEELDLMRSNAQKLVGEFDYVNLAKSYLHLF